MATILQDHQEGPQSGVSRQCTVIHRSQIGQCMPERGQVEDYWRDVQAAAKRGWACDDGYYKAGVMTVAVPVFDAASLVSHILVAIMFRGQLELKAHRAPRRAPHRPQPGIDARVFS